MLQNFLRSLPIFKKQMKEAQHVVDEAKLKAKEEILKAKEEAVNLKTKAERDVQDLQSQLRRKENDLRSREQDVEKNKRAYDDKLTQLEQERTELAAKRDEILAKLERAAKLSQSEAKELILKGWEDKLQGEIAKRIKAAEEKIKTEADKKAQEIVIDAMRHGSTDYIAEYTLSTIPIGDDSVKGRICLLYTSRCV